MLNRITGLLLIVFFAACAMPETRIYSLNMQAEKKIPAVSSDVTVVVTVSSPRYLTQPYIAYRTSPYQLAISRYAKWDSPPDEMVRDAFKDSLSAALFREVRTSSYVPNGSYSLNIALKHFERSDEADVSFAEVVFDVSLLSPEGKNLYQSSFLKKIKLEDRSFLSLARGMSSALGEGTEEVRGNIAKAMKP
jgi:uncharacterized lipoprotein YmbA